MSNVVREGRVRAALVILLVAGFTLGFVGATAPAEATVTVACGDVEHGGNTASDYSWAFWSSVNDPDCRVRAAAKCGDSPTDPNAAWYWGPYKYIGSTSYSYCPWHNAQIVTWGFGWSW